MLLFVYGTLKKGMRAHHLMDGAKFVQKLSIPGSLYNGGFPCLKLEGSTMVHGELYEVTDSKVIERLDRYEGHPDLFKRTEFHKTLDDTIQVYVYQGSVEGRPLVAGGKWE